MSHRLIGALIVAFIVSSSVMVLDATVTVATEFREIVADATVIVQGHITDVRSVVVPSGVDSVATVAVDEVIKGGADAFISVRVPGGTVGRYRFVMIDSPNLEVGERALFFLKRGPDNAWRPVGLSMGVCRVQVDKAGRTQVSPPLVTGQTASVGTVDRGDPRRRVMTLKEFESLVRLVIAGQAASTPAVRR